MRLLAFLALIAVMGAAAYWLMRAGPQQAPENAVSSNSAADQQAIDAANRDIENEERAAAAGLGGANNVSTAAGNAAR